MSKPDHSNPFRTSLTAALLPYSKEGKEATAFLKRHSIDEVAEYLLYTGDVIAFMKFYHINPLEALNYIPDELKEFCLSLMS